MKLPLTVRVPLKNPRDDLELDGWREVGVLDTWGGMVDGKNRGAVNRKDLNKAVIIEDYEFTGRLWRDVTTRPMAGEETRRFLAARENDTWTLGDGYPCGFGVFTRNGETATINLIGSRAKGAGVAQDIIRSAIYDLGTIFLWAGTYSDNLAARGLYESLGMKVYRREMVYHKWLTQ